MLEMRPNCEHCDVDLPADRPGALICSIECTWCADCSATVLKGVCPNCQGELRARPTRVGTLLEKYPASKQRVLAKPR
jgi:hypothetical protein